MMIAGESGMKEMLGSAFAAREKGLDGFDWPWCGAKAFVPHNNSRLSCNRSATHSASYVEPML